MNHEDAGHASTRVVAAPMDPPASGDRNGNSVEARKLALLKRSGFFGGDTKGAVITRALSLEDLSAAYRLVHEVFLCSGYIRPQPSGMRLRMFETSSRMATFVAKVGGRVVGVLSVVGDSIELGLPSDTVYEAELEALRATGARLCEVTNQAVAQDFRKSAVPTELIRCAIAHGLQAGYREGIASVSPGHRGFYELLGFRPVGSERSYSKEFSDLVVALSVDLDQYRKPAVGGVATHFVHNHMTDANPFVPFVADWEREAKRCFLNAALLAHCGPAELQSWSTNTPSARNGGRGRNKLCHAEILRVSSSQPETQV
jgi:hypothetical protein